MVLPPLGAPGQVLLEGGPDIRPTVSLWGWVASIPPSPTREARPQGKNQPAGGCGHRLRGAGPPDSLARPWRGSLCVRILMAAAAVPKGRGGPQSRPTEELEMLPLKPSGQGGGSSGTGLRGRPACSAPGHSVWDLNSPWSPGRHPHPPSPACPPAGSYTMSPRSKGTAEFKRRKTVG